MKSLLSHCLDFPLLFQAAFLLLITLSNYGTKTLTDEQRPVALLCIGCVLIASSVLLFLTSIWKACHKSSKIPRKSTVAVVRKTSRVSPTFDFYWTFTTLN